jgi:hypothetical protein
MTGIPKDLTTLARVLAHPATTGIFAGGCVARGIGSSFRRSAHAHTHDAHTGWICLRTARHATNRALLLHELAHVITRRGHDDRWRTELLALGGSLDPIDGEEDCHKRTRTLKDRRRPHLGYQHHPACPCHVERRTPACTP